MKLNVLNHNSNGLVIYDGPSVLTHDRIFAVATGLNNSSVNAKTGDLIQIYILRHDVNPIDAWETGDDDAICGDCKHRSGSCYVNIGQAPLGIYKTFKNNRYVKASEKHLSLFANRNVRLGAYGDPAAVPIEIWQSICGASKNWTGYTHQWKSCDQRLKNYCMASVDTDKELELAREKGWRTFRVKDANESNSKYEFNCPASKEENKRLTCAECMACNGGDWNDKKGTPVIVRHGSPWKLNVYKRESLRW